MLSRTLASPLLSGTALLLFFFFFYRLPADDEVVAAGAARHGAVTSRAHDPDHCDVASQPSPTGRRVDVDGRDARL